MKTFITLFLFFTFLGAQAQIKPIVSFETGYCDFDYKLGGLYEGFKQSDIKNYNLYSEIILGARYKGFTISTSVLNVFGDFQKTTFTPYQTEYIFKINYTFNKFTIGYEHMCSHPIVNSLVVETSNDFRASFDKLYIKIDILK